MRTAVDGLPSTSSITILNSTSDEHEAARSRLDGGGELAAIASISSGESVTVCASTDSGLSIRMLGVPTRVMSSEGVGDTSLSQRCSTSRMTCMK